MLHSLELFLINMIPSLVNSYDIFMATASAVILNTIGLFYHVNYISYKKSFVLPGRVSLSRCWCRVGADDSISCAGPSLCPAGPHYLGSSRHYTEIVKLIPAPPPPRPHIAAHNPGRNLIWYSVFNQNRSVTLSIPIDTYYCFQTSDSIYCKCNLHS